MTRRPSHTGIALLATLLAVMGMLPVLGCAQAAGSATRYFPIVDADRQERTLRELEHLGAKCYLPSPWRKEYIEITLDAAWKGNNEDLAHLRDVQSIYGLTLDSATIGDEGLRQLAGMRRIEAIFFKSTVFSDAGATDLQHIPALAVLSVDDASAITDRGLREIGRLDLTWLILRNARQITDEGLSELGAMTNLWWLEIEGATNITGLGLADLHALQHLRELLLPGSQLDDQALRHVAAMRRLRRLDLSGTNVQGTGLVHLTGLHRLGEVVLNATPFDKQNLARAQLPHLMVLELKKTGVTDADLALLPNLPNLKTVILDD
jgi:hypothetical protein